MNKKISLTKLAKDPGCLSEYDPNSVDFYSAQQWISQFINPVTKRETVTIDAVSYTHLTLPTRLSV